MGCISCGRGFHSECEVRCRNCHPDVEEVAKSLKPSKFDMEVGTKYGAPIKEAKHVKDRFSTGRKRAAALYPIIETNPCEWQGQKNCGGGHPIVGCISGLQEHRHHGPIKDTLRNEPGNVHRICNNCHSRWHAENNPRYDPLAYEKLPHKPEPATELELALAEAARRTR